jgi:tetraacyldisaccharide 4'-kinase
MKVIERYPVTIRLLRLKGIWRIFYPLLLILSMGYSMWLKLAEVIGNYRRKKGGKKRDGVRRGSYMVVSIGNIEVGGGGKTPCTIAIAEGLIERGRRPVVVTRGYMGKMERRGPIAVWGEGSSGEGVEGIQLQDGEGRTFEEYRDCNTATMAKLIGDEAVIYRRRGIDVVIGKDRKAGIELADRIFSPTHILLDDAFQNRKLEKDFDVILLDHENPLGDESLLPLGTLREPKDAIARADIVIFSRSYSSEIPDVLKVMVKGKDIFFSSHRSSGLIERDNKESDIYTVEGKKVAIFSGIARPKSFEELIEAIPAECVFSFRFRDHHNYRKSDIDWMISKTGGGLPFVTTEKDWVKVSSMFPDDIDTKALKIDIDIKERERLIKIIETFDGLS